MERRLILSVGFLKKGESLRFLRVDGTLRRSFNFSGWERGMILLSDYPDYSQKTSPETNQNLLRGKKQSFQKLSFYFIITIIISLKHKPQYQHIWVNKKRTTLLRIINVHLQYSPC